MKRTQRVNNGTSYARTLSSEEVMVMPVGLLLLFMLVAFALYFDQDGRGEHSGPDDFVATRRPRVTR